MVELNERGIVCCFCGSSEGNSLSHECPKRDAEIEHLRRNGLLIEKTQNPEAVDHPTHYGGDTVYETIKVLKAWLTHEEYIGFLKGNIIKYHSRARKKGGTEDVAKAGWYQDELEKYLKEYV